MKKLYLIEVNQNNTKSYVGSASARDLVRLATKEELKQPQEAQRPIDPKRLDEISSYVMTDGTIATSIVIGTRDSQKLAVHKVEGFDGLYYTEFPETEEEFKNYENSFDIMDGQHRLFSFLEDVIKIDDSIEYQLTFNMYITPTLRERRLIFKNTNEEQKQVPSNLLLWFRKQLDMLTDKEKTYHPVVELLNTESCSPLKNRIIMGAETIPGGYKAEQIINILSKADVKNIPGYELTAEKEMKLLSEYLSGWEIAVGSKISDRNKDVAPFSKIAGFRFMIVMLPAFYDRAITEQKSFNKEFVANTIKNLFFNEGYIPSDIFNPNSQYIKGLGINPYGGETPTTVLAKEWENKLKLSATNTFDPLA